MRKLLLTMSMSLDGFVCGRDGDTRWIFSGDQEAIAWKLEVFKRAGLIIMGKRSFQAMAPFWPTADNVFAPEMNRIPKAVFSKEGPAVLEGAAKAIQDARASKGDAQALHPGADSWAQAHVATGDLAEEIHQLKSQDGAPILAIGGAAFARSLIAANLVDEFVLMVHPIALGGGEPIFSDLVTSRPLELISSTAFPLGSIAQVYRPATA
ncbi:dihydrofolate reductase family protein [Pseudoxanthomonas indica]|uniref:Dihydrofolate reductase n=1 Tax=Pseudoxanthomonas indica TaxID=428993 RepID=A0A1T5K9W0_9GAMM|nr:dihydrofolate reductase family protein [Pseudoxanthomonas indica]GGD47802.1 dihydrofolate reductase [Pseudoxanthomonas indica]SKC60473.1 Dihydrofolate reductase [Pseudoxanthomonas indica]